MAGTNFDINWFSTDPKVLAHPLYLEFSASQLATIDINSVRVALAKSVYSKETAAIIAYLSGLIRVLTLLGG